MKAQNTKKLKTHRWILRTLMPIAAITSCATLETGGKVVDKDRGEVVISSAGDQRSAMPEGSKDTGITKARERSEKFVKENPKDVKALLALAQLQLAQDRLSDAEETSRKVLLLDLKNTEAKKVLAQVAIRKGNDDLALIFLTSLGGEQSKDSSIHNMLGLIAMKRGDNGEAMRLWKQGLSLNSGDISIRMNMGVMYLKNRLIAQASTQFERVLKAAPNHQDARLHLAIIESSRGKNAEAAATYKSILAQDKDNPLALYNLAIAQKNLGENDDAIENLKRYIRVSPERSTSTDHAFALIDEINSVKSSKGEKIYDEDIQTLARELAGKKHDTQKDKSPTRASELVKESGRAAQPSGKSLAPGAKPKTVQAEAKPQNTEPMESPSNSDKDIEALEKQLRAPAH
jgi:tetratricopeptide (TPR) repeat protein